MWNAGTQQPTKMTGGTNGQTWAQPQPGVTQPPMGQPMVSLQHIEVGGGRWGGGCPS